MLPVAAAGVVGVFSGVRNRVRTGVLRLGVFVDVDRGGSLIRPCRARWSTVARTCAGLTAGLSGPSSPNPESYPESSEKQLVSSSVSSVSA